jgi:hypothetical protein
MTWATAERSVGSATILSEKLSYNTIGTFNYLTTVYKFKTILDQFM